MNNAAVRIEEETLHRENILELGREPFAERVEGKSSHKSAVSLDAGRTVRSGMAYNFDSTEEVPPSDVERAARVKASLEGVELSGLESRPVYRFAKRTFDIVFSAAVLVCFSWLFVLVALLIKIDDPKGPVFFKQRRVGKLDADGNPTYFNMLKFRSMCVDAESRLAELKELNEKTGPVFKIHDDPRITRVGKWLRKLSLASVIIGTPGDGEPTKSFSHPANSSLDLQLCERRPELASHAEKHYNSCHFLSVDLFQGLLGGEKGLAAGVFEKLADAFRAECARLCWAVAA